MGEVALCVTHQVTPENVFPSTFGYESCVDYTFLLSSIFDALAFGALILERLPLPGLAAKC